MSSDRSPAGPNPPPSAGDPSLPTTSAQALELQRSVSSAIIEAMGSMSSMISQTISQALATHAPGPSTQLPVLTNPQPTIEPPAQETLTGVIQATHDSALRSRKRALPRQAERTRKWKCARAQTDDIDSDVESDMEAYAEASGQSEGEMESEFPDDAGPRPSTSGSVGASATAPNTVSTLVDPSGIPLFDPDSLHHPRSAEWLPVAHVSDYLEHWVRRPLSKEARSKLRAECPRPLIPNKVCDTPSVDPKMTQFLAKTGWNPRKGLDSAIRSCQDKLLDIFGPLAKIFEMAESARADGSPIDPEELTGWIQRAICIAGSTNSSLAIERRKAILFKIDPKLANLALTESGRDAQGLLFGDSFIKDLSRYVGAFTALDKAQSSMRRVFQGRVSTRAGSSRGRLSGRSSFQARSSGRGSFNQRPPFQDQRNPPPFFPARGSLCRGQTPSLFPRLVQHYIRPVGFDHCTGVPHRAHGFTEPHSFSPTTSPSPTKQRARGLRAVFPFSKEGDREGPFRPEGRAQQHLPSSEERWANASGYKSPGPELRGALPPLQDGGYSPPSGLTDPRGLDGETGPQRCLSDGPDSRFVQGSPALLVEGRSVALHLPPVRPFFGAMVLYQAPASGRCLAAESGCTSSHLSGRHPHYASMSGGPASAPSMDVGPPFGSWFSTEPREVLPHAVSTDGIPGLHGGLCCGISQSPVREIADYPQGIETCPFSVVPVPASPGSHYWPVGLLHPGGVSSPPPLSGPSAPEDCSPSFRGLVRGHGGSGSGGSGVTSLVVRQLGSLERQSDLWISTGIHDRVGRESPGLGCPLRRCLHRGSVVGGREPSSHQRSGTPGGLVCHPQFLQWHGACLHPITYGQCVGGPLCQSPGRHPVGYLGATGEGVLVLLSLQGHHGAGGVPSGSTQRPGGSEFPLLHGRQRLEASAGDVLHDLGYLGPLRRGPLRVTAQYSPSQVLQLAPGSGGGGGGCVPSGLVFGSAIRVSSFRHDPEDAAAGSSSGCGVGGGDPLLGDSSMVPGSPGTPDGRASPPSGSDGSPPGPSGCSSPPAARRLPSAPGVPDLRTPGEVAGISEATRRLLDNAWAPGTRKSYRAAWGAWVSWCVERNLDPVSAPVTHLLQFLTSLFEAGKAYRTINLFRSAISSTHQGFDGVPAGQHPSVSRLLRGSRLARPPRPRFTTTWDVSLVLSFFSAWPENAALSLRQLSAKLLTLFCLISCKRVSDVRALDHDARSFSPEGVTFNITRRTKTNIRSVSYPCFPSSPALCPVACLREYESRTRTHRSATFRNCSSPSAILLARCLVPRWRVG
ncbi:uncharacterized protein LOC122923262 [Bufo gargarizans]|uniref:uncharacterized protein LOC122923262 n=1 Tax=Bufo gargarizans TaxID=30331 RepID=UPI001CF57298|nr:uncharacterized protein LOC122923262 [Bufo gargarizans]